jgi:hypothetical protein
MTICTEKQLDAIRSTVEFDSELLCEVCRPLGAAQRLRDARAQAGGSKSTREGAQ